MQKYKIAILSVLLFLVLSSSVALPTYATTLLLTTNITVETSKTFEINGFTVYAKRIDIVKAGEHYVQVEVKTFVEGKAITIKSEPYLLAKIYPSPKPRVEKSSWLSPVEPGYTIMSATSSTLPKYWWDNILFVKAPGSDYFWVKYDHPDNIETYYPLAKNKAYTLNGASKHHHHIPQYILEDAKYRSTFASIAGLLGPIIAGLLAIPELVSKVVAGIIALVGAILALVGYLIRWFIENIVQTELGDGWAYTWGYGKLTFFGRGIAAWWWMSFGAWRDWGFLITILGGFGGGPGHWVLMK